MFSFSMYACELSFTLGTKKKKHIQHNHVIIVIFLCTLPKVPMAVTATLAWHWKRRQVYVQRGWKMALAMILESLLTTSSIYTYTKISLHQLTTHCYMLYMCSSRSFLSCVYIWRYMSYDTYVCIEYNCTSYNSQPIIWNGKTVFMFFFIWVCFKQYFVLSAVISCFIALKALITWFGSNMKLMIILNKYS